MNLFFFGYSFQILGNESNVPLRYLTFFWGGCFGQRLGKFAIIMIVATSLTFFGSFCLPVSVSYKSYNLSDEPNVTVARDAK